MLFHLYYSLRISYIVSKACLPQVSNKKYRSSKHESDDEPSEPRKRGEIPKQKEPYGQEQKREVVRGRERQVHEEIIARRLGGGEPPTPEAYKHALEQWQQLPGSVIRS